MSSRSATNEGVIEQTTIWFEDGLERTRTLQMMTEPGAYLDVDATSEYQIVRHGDVSLLAIEEVRVASTVRLGPELLTESTITFAPSLVIRPIRLCRGQVWTIDATNTTSTIVRNATTEISSGQIPRAEGRVIELRATISVSAGTYETIHWEGFGIVSGGLFRTENWISARYGFPVRQIVYGADGALIQTTEATEIGWPKMSDRAQRDNGGEH